VSAFLTLRLRAISSPSRREAKELDACVETGIFREPDTLEFSSMLPEK
jgi:hypothetical protein